MKTTLKLLALLLTVALISADAATVTGRSAKTSPAGTEKIPIDDGGTDKYITISNLFVGSPAITTPTITTPTITGGTLSGAAITTSTINGNTITTGTGVLTLAAAKTLTVSNTLTLTGTDGSSIAFGAGGTVAYASGALSQFASTTSAQLAGVLSNETGSGLAVFATSPTLTTPVLGVATATSLNGLTVTTSTGTLTITNGKTLSVSNTLTFTGTDASSVAFGTGGTVAYQGGTLAQFASTTSAQLAGVLSNETGSGLAVFATSPTLTTPTLGVATATTINKLTITAPATGSTLTVADGKTLTASNTLTFTGTDSTSFKFPATSNTVFSSSLSTNDVDAANSLWGASNALVFEGATADAYETSLSPVDPTADQTVSIPNFAVNWAIIGSTLTTNNINAANSFWGSSNALNFEGATADAYELTLTLTDPTADMTVTLPNFAVNYALIGSTLTTNNVDAANSIWGISNSLNFEGATADAYETTVTVTDPTADQTITVPNATGTVILAQSSTTTALTADNQAVTPGVNNRLQLTSDDATSTNRTFTLSATGAITGQIYILIGPATNACELADTGIQKLSATWSPGATDTLTLLFDGTNFIELARADN